MSDRYVQPLRMLVQLAFLGLSLLIGFQFYRFIEAVQQGLDTVSRPAAVDAFLPISGLFGTAAWLKGGGHQPGPSGSGGDLCHHHCGVAATATGLLLLDLSGGYGLGMALEAGF